MNNSSVHLLGNAGQPVTGTSADHATVRLTPAPLPTPGQWQAALNRIAVLEETTDDLQRAVWHLEAWVYRPWWARLWAWAKGTPYV